MKSKKQATRLSVALLLISLLFGCKPQENIGTVYIHGDTTREVRSEKYSVIDTATPDILNSSIFLFWKCDSLYQPYLDELMVNNAGLLSDIRSYKDRIEILTKQPEKIRYVTKETKDTIFVSKVNPADSVNQVKILRLKHQISATQGDLADSETKKKIYFRLFVIFLLISIALIYTTLRRIF